MKKRHIVLLMLSSLLISLLLCSCDDTILKWEESEELYPIELCDDPKEFLQYVNEYASQYDSKIMLDNMYFWYDTNAKIESIHLHYSRRIYSWLAASLTLEYDPNEKGVVHTLYTVGSPKLAGSSKPKDISQWKIGFEEGTTRLKTELAQKGISTFPIVRCMCFDSEWCYSVRSDDICMEVSIDPTM